MIDLYFPEKNGRHAWLVLVEDKSFFLVRSGDICEKIDFIFKKTEFISVCIPKEMAEYLNGGKIIYCGEKSREKQMTLFN